MQTSACAWVRTTSSWPSAVCTWKVAAPSWTGIECSSAHFEERKLVLAPVSIRASTSCPETLIVAVGSVGWLCSVFAFVIFVVVVVVVDVRCPTCVVALISFPAASVDCNWLASWVDWDPGRARGWSSSLLAYWVVRVVVHLVEYFLDRACRHLPN